VLESFPAAQTTHALAPAVPEYVFTGQFAHTAAELAPATPEYAPTAQLIHALAPATLEYVPAMHAVQGPPFGPMYPALQTQLLSNPLEAGAREFTGHRLQFALPSGDH
jgi:hypothetical protein